jgi:hypothetical protein
VDILVSPRGVERQVIEALPPDIPHQFNGDIGRSTGVEGNFVTDSSSATAVSQSALNRRQVSVSHRTLAIALTPSPKGAGFVANT